MEQYVFMTDSDSDLPYALKKQYDIPVVYMPYAMEGKEYFDDLGQTMDHHTYYNRMREGATPVTSALNQADYMEYFEPILKEKDLLFIAFSSQLSCTIQAVYAAREELLAKYPERKFIVVDTLSISGPMTQLILKAHALYREGKPMEEVAQWLEDNKRRAQAWFTVDDLKYLKRGGRVSATSAALGTMLDLKPIIVESKEGKLSSVDKVRGRKKAEGLRMLVVPASARVRLLSCAVASFFPSGDAFFPSSRSLASGAPDFDRAFGSIGVWLRMFCLSAALNSIKPRRRMT